MTVTVELIEQEIIACEICLKEIPRSEIKSDEASDYVRYFFGLECFATWMDQDMVLLRRGVCQDLASNTINHI